ncbi:hypothetical protein FSP39_017675 [Pinctada imbricata]|uniref:Polypeptide N-acetylgalactosaminyltransferase n=1 Tax=Pinctada imbricata TaxID=66713 RepID=A0AA88YVL0_PINIB|nr:hypothetical protein FSP39_017675 [Pinctada imbricata]
MVIDAVGHQEEYVKSSSKKTDDRLKRQTNKYMHKPAGPLEPPDRGNIPPKPEIVDSKENSELDKNIDNGYDGENPNELSKEEDDDDDNDDDENVDELSKFVDNQNVPPSNDKPVIDKDAPDALVYNTQMTSLKLVLYLRSIMRPWSILLRSVHSIINRTPPKLLKEIILVDDFSNMEHLQEPLEKYMDRLGVVKIVRAPKREGLIRARLLGHQAASGTALVFLDSHIECAEGWIEPLLERIYRNWTNVVTPVIDAINDDTLKFNFQPAKQTNVGGFDWSLTFTWHAVPEAEMRRREYKQYLPVRTPTMAGGLFAIGKKFFEQIGTYDEGMDIWGGENLELSFRIWMCGGTLETAPCSHVGHIFRSRSPYSWGKHKNVLRNNNVRMAEVWLDDFKEYYYDFIHHNLGDYGNVSSRHALREQLQCHSFEWFLKNVYPELFVPGEALYSGEIRSKVKSMCLEGITAYGKVGKPLTVSSCHGFGGNQMWYFTLRHAIQREYGCFDYNKNVADRVMVYSCHDLKGNQEWEYREDNTIRNVPSQLCLELSPNGTSIRMKPCIGTDSQIWIWSRKPPKGAVRHWP